MSEWISVEEKLPAVNGEYLIVDCGDVSTADWFSELEEWQTVRSYGVNAETEVIWAVSHWMPLPEPPK